MTNNNTRARRKLAIVGSGDLGQLIAWHAQQVPDFEFAGFLDDFAPPGRIVGEFGTVLGGLDSVTGLLDQGQLDCVSIGIGYTRFDYRESVFEQMQAAAPIATIVHPSCYVDPSAKIGDGCVILPGCTVDHGSVVGENVLLNTGCVLAHHATVQDHSFLAPAVAIAGFTNVGKRCFVGIHSTLIDRVAICDDGRVGAGAVVTRNVESTAWHVGCPARPMSPNS